MLIRIVAVGQRMPAWVDAAAADYLKRMPDELRTELVAIRAEPRGDGSRQVQAGKVPAILEREAERIRQKLPARARLVVLDERGEDLSTTALAQRLGRWQQSGEPVAIVIGGPDGLAADLKSEARECLRLSSLTLPHGLARVLLAEQLYRAWSINSLHPYHRE